MLSADETGKGPFDRFSDSEAVLEHFQTSLISGLTKLVEYANLLHVLGKKKHVTLFLARVLQSLPVLVRTLTVSLRQSSDWGRESAEKLLVSSSTEMYLIWTQELLNDFRQGSNLSNFCLFNNLLYTYILCLKEFK